ncbi:MAG TPA: hypothetical protein P5341_16335 [Hyphomonas sp.]|nr:hypothetical protein [Hyphomonas sp.]
MERSKTGKTVYAEIGVWYDEDQGHIHISIPKSDWFHTTVNANDGSKRCHKNLFAKLGRLLRDEGAPAPPKELTPDYRYEE